MEKFIPDVYQRSIYTIDYKALKKRGIKCLIFDLDNTISPITIPVPEKEVKDLFNDLAYLNFKVIILSNSKKSRVEPFKEKLNVDSSYHSHKPFKKKYKKILQIYNFKDTEIACIGDQLITDIYGANRMGFLSILVNPMSNIELLPTRINRFLEKFILQYLAKRGLFKKGEYYE